MKSEEDLRLFSIRNAVCAVEDDRAIVEGNVASLMQDLTLVQADSTQEEALLAFDRLVRTTLPKAIRDSTGRVRFRYEFLATVFAPMLFFCFDYVGAVVSAGGSIQAVVATVLSTTTFTCAILPLNNTVFAQLLAGCSHFRGPKRTVFVLFVGVASAVCEGFWVLAVGLLHSRALEDLVAFVFLFLASVALFLLTYQVFQEASRKATQAPHRRRLGDTRRIGRGTQIPHSAGRTQRMYGAEVSSSPAFRSAQRCV